MDIDKIKDGKVKEKIRELVNKMSREIDSEFIVLYELKDPVDMEKELLLLIVSEDFAKLEPKERFNKILKHWKEPPKLDIYPYTLLEFKNLLKSNQGYVFEAIEHGIILSDKGIFKKVRDAILANAKEVKINEETIWELY